MSPNHSPQFTNTQPQYGLEQDRATLDADSDTEVSLSVHGIGKAIQSNTFLCNRHTVRRRA